MFRNYLKTAFRNLTRNKLFSGLNIIGLATGMACSILIFLWVQDERSYDRFNTNAAHIYRITSHVMDMNMAITPIPMSITAKKEIPAVKMATTIAPLKSTVTIGHQKFDDKNIFYADSNFLRMFNYPVVKGDPATLLTSPDEIVITESAAKKYFGGIGNAMGKVIRLENNAGGVPMTLTVNAILKDIPHNSHLQFDMLLPKQQYDKKRNPSEIWGNFDVYSYLWIDEHADGNPAAIASLEKQVNSMHDRNDNFHIKSTYNLQALPDIHLQPGLFMDVAGGGNKQYVTIFLLVAIFILLIACINFMNLSTAISGQRAKEVGLRKTVGAQRFQLILQFLSESLLLSLVSLVISIGLVILLLPLFNALAAKSISINLLSVKNIGLLLAIAVAVGVISGSYPALFLSSFNPVKVLKGVKYLHGRTNYFRNGLVVLQFSISVILIISTLVVFNQLQYIRHRDIGFNKDNLLYTKVPDAGDFSANFRALKTKLSEQSRITDYTLISHLPTDLQTGQKVTWPGMDQETLFIAPEIWVDENFVRVFGMKLLAGRFFRKDDIADSKNYVVNETALKKFNMDVATAVGKKITVDEREGEIIGIVKDFNFKPIQQTIEPLILRTYDGYANGTAGFIVVKTRTAGIERSMSDVRNILQPIFPEYPFLQGFVDDDLGRLYIAEQRMGKLFNVFSVLSVIISCLGLFGLATFATQKRIKEIGVRKVLGASAAGIVAMLSKDFIKLVAVALIIAFPVSWLVMNKWLDNFAYRISISWWMFLFAGIMAILIAFLSVSYQSVKAALSNPVKSLRSE
ncbi:FtsX-like permease family protein [Chitinophaga oryziterrae]|uniref:FtsX-like permease family protein n=1 Tax=Chitinophaga oryziterrae TaxID=1031224 RepID=A0A6N8J572_9BACT|nr:ABC transporter permease [Chitinophaga oryziterrae]MVT40377.1 FtsX-like permease family protein [Chitinophaga oryziterrae]